MVANSESLPPLSVVTGKAAYPSLEAVAEKARTRAARAVFVPCRSLAAQAGTAQAANTALLGAATAVGALPFSLEDLIRSVKKHLKPALAEVNLKALQLGADAALKG